MNTLICQVPDWETDQLIRDRRVVLTDVPSDELPRLWQSLMRVSSDDTLGMPAGHTLFTRIDCRPACDGDWRVEVTLSERRSWGGWNALYVHSVCGWRKVKIYEPEDLNVLLGLATQVQE